MRTMLGAAAALAAAALVAAGCGSSGGTTTNASPAVDWANSLCSATTSWQSALTDAATSLKDGPYTQAGLQAAADKVRKATQSYADALKGLGRPDTQAGQDAKTAVDQLQSQLQSGVETMQGATKDVSGLNGVLDAVSVVSGTLAKMGDQMRATVTSLQQLDPKGELRQAFSNASACAALTA